MTQPGHCRILIGSFVVLSVGAIVAGAMAAGGLQANTAPVAVVEREPLPESTRALVSPQALKNRLFSRALKGVVVWIRGEQLALGVHGDESPVILATKATTRVWINGNRADLSLVRSGAQAMVLVVSNPEGIPTARAIRVVAPGDAPLGLQAPST